jgi:hypothetical protein
LLAVAFSAEGWYTADNGCNALRRAERHFLGSKMLKIMYAADLEIYGEKPTRI